MNQAREVELPTRFGTLTGLAWGDPQAPVLLALHGWLDNAASFSRLAPLLADTHHVVALDLPGHGGSAHLPAGQRRYHIVDQIDHVLDAANAFDLTGFDLLGHSLGAGIASMLAAAAPERVRRLALIEGLGPLADDGADTLARWRKAHAAVQHERRVPRVFATAEDAVAARVAAGDLGAQEVRPIVLRNLRRVDAGWAWASDARLRLPTPVRLAESQVRQLLTGISASTCLLLADPTTPYLAADMMRARAACVADIHIAHLSGPHHLHIRHAADVAAAVEGFLDAGSTA